MKIKSLKIKNYHGLNFSIKFIEKKRDSGCAIILGLNGSGKSTVLNLLAGLSGNDLATRIISGQPVGYAKIVIIDKNEEYTYETKDNFDYDSIIEFKKTLPTRTSYVLPHDYDEHRFVTEIRDGEVLFSEMKTWLSCFSVPLEDCFYFNEGKGAQFMMGQTSAQRYLFTMSFRKAPEHTPMLLDYIERNVHVISRRNFHEFYSESDDQQIIATTHCPTVLTHFMNEHHYKVVDLTK